MNATGQLLNHLIDADGTSAQSRRFHRGDILRICPRRYVETATWLRLNPTQRFVLTVHAAAQTHPSAVVAGSSALFVRGFRMLRPTTVLLSTPKSSRAGIQANGFRVHGTSQEAMQARRVPAPPLRLSHISTIETVEHHGTTVEPTLDAMVRLLSSTAGIEALCACDALCLALRIPSLAQWDPLQERLEQIEFAVTRERATSIAAASSDLAGSVAESMSRFLILDAGFPAPELQVAHWDAQGLIGYSDFWWPGLRLIGEVDGMQKYVDPAMGNGLDPAQRIRREKARDNRLSAQVNRVLHWQWEDLVRRGALVALLRAAGLRTDRNLRPWP